MRLIKFITYLIFFVQIYKIYLHIFLAVKASFDDFEVFS